MTKKSTRAANKLVTTKRSRRATTFTTANTTTTVDTGSTITTATTTTTRRRSQRSTTTNNNNNNTAGRPAAAAAAAGGGVNSRTTKKQRRSNENKSTTHTVDSELPHTSTNTTHGTSPVVASTTLSVTPGTPPSSPVVAGDKEPQQSCREALVVRSIPAASSTEVVVPAAAAAADDDTTLDRQNKSGTSSGEYDKNKSISIACGDKTASLYLGVTSKQRCRDKCVLYKDQWLTPNEFQSVCGRSAAKDWKRTIKHGGQCVKTLLTQGVLIIDGKTASCHCKHCLTQGISESQLAAATSSSASNSDDVTAITSSSASNTGDVTKSVDSNKKTSQNKRLKSKNNKKRKQKELKTQEQVDDKQQQQQQQQQQQHSDVKLSCDLVADIKCEQELVICEVGTQEQDNGTNSSATSSTTQNTKTTKLSHLSQIINELKQNKMKMSSNVNKMVIKTDVDCKQCPLVAVDDCTDRHQASSLESASSLETMQSTTFPTFPPFYGLNPAQLAALSPAHLASMSAPFQMQYPPPYIFMGFPLNPQLLQSYPLTSAQLAGTTLRKRKHEADDDRLTSSINSTMNLTHQSHDVSCRSPVDLSGSKVTAHGSTRQNAETDGCGALNLSIR